MEPAPAAPANDERLARRELAWLAALMVVVLLVRVAALNADPGWSVEDGYINDFGQWWKGARLHAVWGVWNLDDYNIGLWMAPGYTLAVRLAYALLGVGYAQGYLVNALSGTLTALAVYALARSQGTAPQAFLATLLVGLNPLTIVHDRSGFVESFQLLFVVAAVACVFVRPRSLAVAALGGLAAALAVVAKASGAVIAPILVAVTAACFVGDRLMRLPPRFEVRRFAVMAAVAAAGVAIFAIAFVLPHRDAIARQFEASSQGFFSPVGQGAKEGRVGLLGWTTLGFRFNGFFRMQWYLVGLVALTAAARITRTMRRPLTQVELACWMWLVVGVVYLARFYYQPDRRFLILVPPMAVIGGGVLGADVQLGPSAWSTARAQRVAYAVAGALVGGVAGFYAVPLGAWKSVRLGGLLGFQWSYEAGGSFLVTTAAVCGALAAFLVGPRLRLTSPRLRHAVLPALLALVVLAQWTSRLTHRSYGIQRVSEALARLTDRWPPGERSMAGWSATTLATGTRLLGVNFETRGRRATDRYHPRLEVYAPHPGERWMPSPVFHDSLPGREPKVECFDVPISVVNGVPGKIVHVLIDSALAGQCRGIAAAEPAGAPAH